MTTDKTLAVAKRDTIGTGKLNALRAQGVIPGVIYGPAVEGNINVQAKDADIRTLFAGTENDSVLVNLDLEGQKLLAIVKHVQYNHRTDSVTHFDLEAVTPDSVVRALTPVHLTGTPVGVAMGGQVHQIVHDLPIKCAVKDIPAEITADVSELKLGDSLRLAQVALPENVGTPFNGTVVIASVVKA